MTKSSYKTIGILGGMGPEATIQLFNYIVKLTPAKHDHEHLPILINNIPQIPDRTQALLYGGENPLPYMVKASQVLEDAGADFIVVVCNTSHAFFAELQKKIRTPLVNMIEETASYIKTNFPHVDKVGLLATTGTIKTRLYQKHLEAKNISGAVPDGTHQEKYVMEAIYGKMGIKAGFVNRHPRQALLKAAKKLVKKGAQAIVMGCTEIPLVLDGYAPRMQAVFVNPTEILARKAIQLATRQDALYPQDHKETFKQAVLEYEVN